MRNKELKRIIDQLQRLHTKNWPGLDVYQMLNEIDDEIANTKLSFFTHTIHQTMQHLLTDNSLVIKRLQGINYKLTKEEDWIPWQQLKAIKWSDTKNAFLKSKDDLVNALQSMCDDDLNNPILKDYSTIYVTLHGHLQHAYYHLGQIAQMKKVIEHLNKR